MLQERQVRATAFGTCTTGHDRPSLKWILVMSFSLAWYSRNVKMVSLSPLSTSAINAGLFTFSVAALFMIQCLNKRAAMPEVFKTMSLETYCILGEDVH